jgi:DNA-binding NarL/FixJ family response regulator
MTRIHVLKASELFTTITAVRTCYRCGSEFRSAGERICAPCRKPKVKAVRAHVIRTLSFREKQIVDLVRQAKLNKEIAYELHLTEGTIKEYLNRIYRKLEVKNRTDLAIWAFRNEVPMACRESA